MSKEQRIFPRTPCIVDLGLVAEGEKKPQRVKSLDLSMLGIGLVSPEESPPPGTPVRLGTPGDPPVEGVVRWRRGFRSGVQFSHQWDEVMQSWVGDLMSTFKSKTKNEVPLSDAEPAGVPTCEGDVTIAE